MIIDAQVCKYSYRVWEVGRKCSNLPELFVAFWLWKNPYLLTKLPKTICDVYTYKKLRVETIFSGKHTGDTVSKRDVLKKYLYPWHDNTLVMLSWRRNYECMWVMKIEESSSEGTQNVHYIFFKSLTLIHFFTKRCVYSYSKRLVKIYYLILSST